MATVYSIQRARQVADGNQYSNGLTETGAKTRIAYFEYITAGDASGTVIELTKIPKGSKILRGKVARSALGASVTVSVGNIVGSTATAAAYLAAADFSALGVTDIVATVALGFLADTTAETTITATTGGAALPVGGYIKGFIEYVQN